MNADRDHNEQQCTCRVETLLYAAWDDGNALGLDGWIGPERGEDPDPHAIDARRRHVSGALDALSLSGREQGARKELLRLADQIQQEGWVNYDAIAEAIRAALDGDA